MNLSSKTGLLASPTKKLRPCEKLQKHSIQLKAITGPAPFILKPFAGLYNPYPYGCSLLCNHPADNEARNLLKKAKHTWTTEGKSVLLADEVAAIRASLEQLHCVKNRKSPPPIESVPEELFRRYTETDSRPLTPAPTLASAHTRASGSRRCVTPDPIPTSEVREKTLLVLDLRRSHSQETLSWHANSLEPPLIRVMHISTREASPEPYVPTPGTSRKKSGSSVRSPRENKIHLEVETKSEDKPEELEEEDVVKRRGKKRRKRGRDSSRGPPAFQSSIDPETQVATIGPESYNPSARPSLIPGGISQEMINAEESTVETNYDLNSYLNAEVLKQLRRELNEEVVDNEFNLQRRKALEEALKTRNPDKKDCAELVKIQKELKLRPPNTDLWLSLPRVFTRSSARFELPMDSRLLNHMTPLNYLKDHVSISSPRKLLYNVIFNRYKIEDETQRKISGDKLSQALNEMMGKPLTEQQMNNFRKLIGWKNDDLFDYKTFCGVCSCCERLLALEYCPQMPSRKGDPVHEIEAVDFESLKRRLEGQYPDKRLVILLHAIKDS